MNRLTIKDDIKFNLVELKKWEKFEISWNKIITVVVWKISDREKWVLEKFESSVYHSGKIEALEDSLLTVFDIKDLDIILNKINVEEKFWDYCRKNWKQLRELYDVEGFEKVDLYRWDQLEKEYNWKKYKFNLWFCWKEVNCLFHNQHDFIEIHTNLAWDWYMQKAEDEKWEKLIETVWLLPWNSHKTFNIKWEKEENWNPKYPIHRYLWGTTGNVWLAIEEYEK